MTVSTPFTTCKECFTLPTSFNGVVRIKTITNYECSMCCVKIASQSKETYTLYPNLLMCHLLRFISSSGKELKDRRPIFFPSSLYLMKDNRVHTYTYPSCMDTYCHISFNHVIYNICPSFDCLESNYRSREGAFTTNVYEYKLKTIIHHIGNSIQNGLYVVNVLSLKRSSNIWLRYNDEIVKEVPESIVFCSDSHSTAYMILYE